MLEPSVEVCALPRCGRRPGRRPIGRRSRGAGPRGRGSAGCCRCLGDAPFDEFRDADDLLAPVLEVITPAGYCWVPWEQVQFLEVDAAPRTSATSSGRRRSSPRSTASSARSTRRPATRHAPPPPTNRPAGRMTDWPELGGPIVRGRAEGLPRRRRRSEPLRPDRPPVDLPGAGRGGGRGRILIMANARGHRHRGPPPADRRTRPGRGELAYEPEYDAIREARRAEDELSQTIFERKLKAADWDLVVELAEADLAGKSKDLQIAAWLTEALGQLHASPDSATAFGCSTRSRSGTGSRTIPGSTKATSSRTPVSSISSSPRSSSRR